MRLFDRTAKHLAAGPTLFVPVERVDDVTELLHRYDPGLTVKSDRYFFANGVLLYGPVEPSEPGVVGYYARAGALPKRAERSEGAKLLDGELLVRGLAVRLGAAKRSEQPWAELLLTVSVYAEAPLPIEQVISVLQPFAGTERACQLTMHEHKNFKDSYFLVADEPLPFLTNFWPGYLSRFELPPLALGPLRDAEPCRWELEAADDVTTAGPDLRRLVAEAGLALAAVANGVVVDVYGFPVTSVAELLAS